MFEKLQLIICRTNFSCTIFQFLFTSTLTFSTICQNINEGVFMQETLAEADWNNSISRATCWLLRSSISFTQKGGKMSNYFYNISSERKIGAANMWKGEILFPHRVGYSTQERMSLWWDRQSIWKYGRREKKAYLIYHMTLHVWLERRDEVEPKDLAECEKAHF